MPVRSRRTDGELADHPLSQIAPAEVDERLPTSN
jgi:hypothetical protein